MLTTTVPRNNRYKAERMRSRRTVSGGRLDIKVNKCVVPAEDSVIKVNKYGKGTRRKRVVLRIGDFLIRVHWFCSKNQ